MVIAARNRATIMTMPTLSSEIVRFLLARTWLPPFSVLSCEVFRARVQQERPGPLVLAAKQAGLVAHVDQTALVYERDLVRDCEGAEQVVGNDDRGHGLLVPQL